MIQVKKHPVFMLPDNIEICIVKYNVFKQKGRKFDIKIACEFLQAIYNFHNKLFNIVNGKYVQNTLGKHLNAQISDSSFTIIIKPNSIKQAAKLLSINTVNICTY